MIPEKLEELKYFGIEGINALALFYGRTVNIADALVTQIVNGYALRTQYEAYMLFVPNYRLNFEVKQQSTLSLVE